jgi:hypothetical protein
VVLLIVELAMKFQGFAEQLPEVKIILGYQVMVNLQSHVEHLLVGRNRAQIVEWFTIEVEYPHFL